MSDRNETTTDYLRRKEREGIRVRKPTLWEECDASPHPIASKILIGWFGFLIVGFPLLAAAIHVFKAAVFGVVR